MLGNKQKDNSKKEPTLRPSVKDDAQAQKQQMLAEQAAASEQKSVEDEKPEVATQVLETKPEETESVQVEDNHNAQPSVKESQEKAIVDFDEDETHKKQESVNKPKSKHFLLKTFVTLIVVILLFGLIYGVWNRWFRYDDQALLVSNWQISGTNQIVPITEKTITLAPNAVLEYTLDTGAKVINYKIGDKTGQSHYRFSWDTNQVALIESGEFDAVSTLVSDFCWFWDWSTCGMSNIDLSPAYTKNNKEEVDTENTGLDDIMNNGRAQSILLDKITTKEPKEPNKV